CGQLAIPAVPERVDRQHFHVDRLLIHRSKALLDLDEGGFGVVDRRQLHARPLVAEQRAGLAEMAMGVDVDGLDALAADTHGEFLPWRLRVGAVNHAAAAKYDAGSRRLEEIATCSHSWPPWSSFVVAASVWQPRLVPQGANTGLMPAFLSCATSPTTRPPATARPVPPRFSSPSRSKGSDT